MNDDRVKRVAAVLQPFLQVTGSVVQDVARQAIEAADARAPAPDGVSALEHAAKAMWDAQERYLGTHTPWEEADPAAGKALTIRLLSAALDALMEPTETMLEAARDAHGYDPDLWAEDGRAKWQAMMKKVLGL